MTRANFEIICSYPKKHYFERGSDGYLSGVLPDIFEFILSCAHLAHDNKRKLEFYDRPGSLDFARFVSECNLTMGSVGNFSYVYEIDFNKQTVKAWDSKTRWVNAPEDWEARGWGCWKGKNGKFGYTNWVKGKLLVDIKFTDMVSLAQTIKGFQPIVSAKLLDELIKKDE